MEAFLLLLGASVALAHPSNYVGLPRNSCVIPNSSTLIMGRTPQEDASTDISCERTADGTMNCKITFEEPSQALFMVDSSILISADNLVCSDTRSDTDSSDDGHDHAHRRLKAGCAVLACSAKAVTTAKSKVISSLVLNSQTGGHLHVISAGKYGAVKMLSVHLDDITSVDAAALCHPAKALCLFCLAAIAMEQHGLSFF